MASDPMKVSFLSDCCFCCLVTKLWPTLFATPWTVACQAPLSMGFSRQEYWSGLPFPPPGDLPDPGIEPCLLHFLHWQAEFSPLSQQGSPFIWLDWQYYLGWIGGERPDFDNQGGSSSCTQKVKSVNLVSAGIKRKLDFERWQMDNDRERQGKINDISHFGS